MAKLKAADLKALPDDMFGLPKTRQYPMPDEEHVRSAIRFFRYCKEKDRKELAENIVRRAKELKMKIKVQPSNPFYKYAKKYLSPDGEIILEFHIGQLSPIVPLQPERILSKFQYDEKESKVPFLTQMDKLKRIWDNQNISTDKKTNMSHEILKECISLKKPITADIFMIYEAIDMINYLQTPIPDSTTNNLPLAYRISDNDSLIINDLMTKYTDEIPKEIIANNIKKINNTSKSDLAYTYILYNNLFSKDTKDYVADTITDSQLNDLENRIYISNSTLNKYLPIFSSDDKSRINSDGVDENAIAHIEAILRLVENPFRLESTVVKLAKKALSSDFIINNDIAQIHLIKMVNEDEVIKGYHVIDIQEKPFFFIENFDGSIYYTLPLQRNGGVIDFFCVKVFKPGDQDYNDNFISYICGAKLDGFKLSIKGIRYNPQNSINLESQDFKDLLDGFRINGKGNISLIIGIDRSWYEKLSLCEKEMKTNLSEESEDLSAYKHNLCFLFALINVINRDYANWSPNTIGDKGSEDYKDAIKTMNKAIELFKEGIKTISKRDTEFVFTKFFIANDYASKLDIFEQGIDDGEFDQKVLAAYNWIIR